MSKKEMIQTVILLRDDVVAYLRLAQNKEGFYVYDYDRANLEPGVIKNGEILRADFLQKILFKVHKKIQVKDIHLIIPHEHFGFDTHSFKRDLRKKIQKQISLYLKKNKSTISWAKTHGYEYQTFFNEKDVTLFFRTLPHEMHETYSFVFKKAGFNLKSIQSDNLSFNILLPKEGFVSQLYVGLDKTYLIDYKDGVYLGEKIFDFSYHKLILDIQKGVSVSSQEARKILEKYGILRIHPDKKVYRDLCHDLTPIISFLKKRNNNEKRKLFIHEADFPISGLIQHLRLALPLSIHEFSFHEHEEYPFHEVLDLHKKESYFYEPLISYALSFFKKTK